MMLFAYVCRPIMQKAVLKISAIEPSASGCEQFWSVEGWMHDKKRNRMGQTVVERLMRAHTNLILEDILDMCTGALADERPFMCLPWDIELCIDEPDDGPVEAA